MCPTIREKSQALSLKPFASPNCGQLDAILVTSPVFLQQTFPSLLPWGPPDPVEVFLSLCAMELHLDKYLEPGHGRITHARTRLAARTQRTYKGRYLRGYRPHDAVAIFFHEIATNNNGMAAEQVPQSCMRNCPIAARLKTSNYARFTQCALQGSSVCKQQSQQHVCSSFAHAGVRWENLSY